jgi:hypothetical protein
VKLSSFEIIDFLGGYINGSGGYTAFLGACMSLLARYMGFFGGSIDFLVGYG